MRGSEQRPRSQHGAQTNSSQTAGAPSRRIFNCIVDDTALVAGVKKTTRNGIRQWVKNTQIRLFVPLHALEQLSRQKSGTSRHAEDVRETLKWLDDATTRYPHAITLQGGDQHYQTWSEVEAFSVPRTLFSEYDAEHEEDAHGEEELVSQIQPLTLAAISSLQHGDALPDDEGKSLLGSAISQAARSSLGSSPPSSTSPISRSDSPRNILSSPQMAGLESPVKIGNTQSAKVPQSLRSLLNYILWRVNRELNPTAALESWVFLCNDPAKVNHARGFDIRSKKLEQLREAVGREDREFRNRQLVQKRESAGAQELIAESKANDRVGLGIAQPNKSPQSPAAVLAKTPPKQSSPATNLIDPNSFGRGQHTTAKDMPQSPRTRPVDASPRNGFIPRSPRGHARGGLSDGRGRGGRLGGGRVGSPRAGDDAQSDMSKSGEIDPHSFARPRDNSSAGRGGRKLWMPT